MGAKILVVDDEAAMRLGLKEVLSKEGYEVEVAADGDEAVARLDKGGLDVVVTDLRMPKRDGLAVLAHARSKDASLLVYMITAYGDVPTAVEAMKAGATDFIMKPFKIDDVRTRIRTGLVKKGLKAEGPKLTPEQAKELRDLFPEIVGESNALLETLRVIRKIAPTDATVLVRGETGTGKELVARALHRLSKRKEGPFVATTGAIPEGLWESELFGHAKGAFTGAVKAKDGYFEAASKGTFFLDEVGDIPPGMQVKLLRAIQEKEVVRLGEAMPRKCDVRLVAATNRDLEAMIKEKAFREDLFFRLNVVSVKLPPLRERIDDVAPLAVRFLETSGKKIGRTVALGPGAVDRLKAHRWPGNIRELFQACERLAILAPKDEVGPDDVAAALA
jgi:DNA-binding NtrC family response regulator